MGKAHVGVAATLAVLALLAGCAPTVATSGAETVDSGQAIRSTDETQGTGDTAPADPEALEPDATASDATPVTSVGATSVGTTSDSTDATITVSAHAEVRVTPDTASFGATITSEGATAAAARKANATPTNAVISKLKELGVPEKSIQTTSSGVGPKWSDGDEGGEETFEATTRLQVSDVDVDELAELMAAVVEAGATGVDGPDYTTGAYDDAYEEALVAAVKAARPKAETIAKAAGVSLGDVIGVTEGYQDNAYRALATAEADVATDDLEILEPGEIAVTANVTVSYRIG